MAAQIRYTYFEEVYIKLDVEQNKLWNPNTQEVRKGTNKEDWPNVKKSGGL